MMGNDLMRKQAIRVGKMYKLPDDWQVKQIKEILDLESGVWDKENEKGYPVLRSTNFSETGYIDFNDVTYRDIEDRKVNDKKLKKGDILLEISGGGPSQPVGRVVYFYEDKSKDYLFGNFIKRLRLRNDMIEENNSYYIFRFLERYYDIGQTETLQHQTTGIRNLDYRAYISLPLPLPPLPEQKKIADILSTVDENISKTEEVIEKTKELKKGLMQDLLTKGIGHSEFKNSKFGRIPKVWNVKIMSDVARINPRYNVPDENGFLFLNMDSVNEDSPKVDGFEIRKKEKCTNIKFKQGDVLFARITPSTENGKTALIENLEEEIAFASTELIVLSPKKNFIISKYIYYILKWHRIRSLAISMMEGSTGRQRVPREVFDSSIKIPLPPLQEQKKIANILSTVDEKIQKEEEYKEKLELLKKGLMQKLLTGEVRVKVAN